MSFFHLVQQFSQEHNGALFNNASIYRENNTRSRFRWKEILRKVDCSREIWLKETWNQLSEWKQKYWFNLYCVIFIEMMTATDICCRFSLFPCGLLNIQYKSFRVNAKAVAVCLIRSIVQSQCDSKWIKMLQLISLLLFCFIFHSLALDSVDFTLVSQSLHVTFNMNWNPNLFRWSSEINIHCLY